METTKKIMKRLDIINYDIAFNEKKLHDFFERLQRMVQNDEIYDYTTNNIINTVYSVSGIMDELKTITSDLKELQHEKSELEYFLR